MFNLTNLEFSDFSDFESLKTNMLPEKIQELRQRRLEIISNLSPVDRDQLRAMISPQFGHRPNTYRQELRLLELSVEEQIVRNLVDTFGLAKQTGNQRVASLLWAWEMSDLQRAKILEHRLKTSFVQDLDNDGQALAALIFMYAGIDTYATERFNNVKHLYLIPGDNNNYFDFDSYGDDFDHFNAPQFN